MAHNEISVKAAPREVFSVLSDPRSYARWVVGSQKVRRADRDWPAIGTAFDHRVGLGPIGISDSTEVEACEPPHLLQLLVKARPLSKARVTLRLDAEGEGTRVRMEEVAADAKTKLLFNRLTDPLVRLRNAESLRRLKRLAEGAEAIPTGPLPPRGSAVEAEVKGSSAPAVS